MRQRQASRRVQAPNSQPRHISSGAKGVAMRAIVASGRKVLVSDCDYDSIARFTWYAHIRSNGKPYVFRVFKDENGKCRTVYMHREITRPENRKIQVDHINQDPLDNRRENLRLATASQNQANRGAQSNNKSGYKGVYYRKGHGVWVAQINIKNRHITIGNFATKEAAAAAYAECEKKLFGEFAFSHGV